MSEQATSHGMKATCADADECTAALHPSAINEDKAGENQRGPSIPDLVSGVMGVIGASKDGPRVVYQDDPRGVAMLQANCLVVLDALAAEYPAGCFDMAFVDPPYFLSNGGITCHAGCMVKVDKGSWDKSRGPEMNHEFNTEWLSRCQRVLKPDGTIWITGTHHVIFSVGFALQQLGFKILNDIAWEKPNPPPNLSCRYFTHSTETVIWAAKNDRSRHYFNYRLMKSLNDDRQMKTVWRICAPSKAEKGFGRHPTQKPLALVERCLEAATRAGDLVLDPFMGSGTSAVASARLGRRFLGIELEPAFAQTAVKRLRQEASQVRLPEGIG